VGVTQPLLAQHPLGHDAELQMHSPPTHCWPAAHAGPPPQLHCPVVQPSATNAVHETHAAPKVPHEPGPGASQFAPAQHPEAQLEGVHEVQMPA